MPVTSAQCIIGIEKYSDSAVLLNYNDHRYSQGYGQMKEAFRALTKDFIIHTYLKMQFRSSTDGDHIGYKKKRFDILYQKNFEGGQSVKVEFKFSEKIPTGIYGYALVLINKLVDICSDGQRLFDLV